MRTSDPEYLVSVREVIASPFKRLAAAIEQAEE